MSFSLMRFNHFPSSLFRFDESFSPFLAPVASKSTARIQEQDQAFEVSLDVPGVALENLKLEVLDKTLSVRFRRDGSPEQMPSTVREFALPDNVNAAQISAHLKNGVLSISLPKQEQARPRAIQIAVDAAA